MPIGNWVGGTLPALLAKEKRAETWQLITSQENETLLERHELGSWSAWVKSHPASHELCDLGQAT